MITTTLDDVVSGTIFSIVGNVWMKGSSQRGAGPEGKTKCYPKLGGQFQTGDKFSQYLDNKTQIQLSEY